MEEVCFGEEFEIQFKNVTKGRLEPFGGLVIKKYKFEDPELDQNAEEDRLWLE